jgi:hypothetical protein
MQVKFVWNGIKVDGKLYRAYYWSCTSRNMPEGTITIRAKDYASFPEIPGLRIINETDLMTDYFDHDRVYVTPKNHWYPQVLEAYNRAQEHRERMRKRA